MMLYYSNAILLIMVIQFGDFWSDTPKVPHQMSLPEFWLSLCELQDATIEQKSNNGTPLRDSVLSEYDHDDGQKALGIV